MYWDLLERHLLILESHHAGAQAKSARQRDLIATLKRDGHDVAEAQKLLALFEEVSAIMLADRELRLKESEKRI